MPIKTLLRAGVMLLVASSSVLGEVIETDICIFGGTSGGVIAGVQAVRMGKRAVITEFGRHLGASRRAD